VPDYKRICRILAVAALLLPSLMVNSQGTRLLRQPDISSSHIVFSYGGDIWITDRDGQNLMRLTSTPAIEGRPHFSPDGKWVAFNSNRSGIQAVYVVSASGGSPVRLTWYPAPASVCGWTTDGTHVLYSTSRDNAPTGFARLWTVSRDGGPSELVSAQWAFSGSFSPDGSHIVIDRVQRWDVEWRQYRGGQNTPLVILNLSDQTEKLLPYASTIDIQPKWIDNVVYLLSDRDGTSNIWSYEPNSEELAQITQYTGSDIKLSLIHI
jgi:tricorn protease